MPAPTGVRGVLDTAARLRDAGDPGRAIDLCRQAAAAEPANPEIPFTAATVYETIRDYRNAVKAYGQVLKLKPGFLPALVNCAACLADLGELPESLDLYQKAVRADPNAVAIRQNMADVLLRLKRPQDAAIHLRRLAMSRGEALDFTALAEALDLAGDAEGALAAYAKALEFGAPPAPTRVLMARVSLARGDLTNARPHLDAALAADPLDGHAHHALASNDTDPASLAERIAMAESALASTADRPVEIAAAPLNFALGHLHDRAGRFDRAFEHFAAGNALFAERMAKADDELEARARRVIGDFTPEFLTRRRDWGDSTGQPVFVFGLPRSGTTLIEQILASHPRAEGLGERDMTGWMAAYLATPTRERAGRAAEAYLASYPAPARGKARVIDKSLASYLELGLLLLLFPNARFINCLRHPMDVAFSAWSHYFAANALVYTYSFERLARHMRLYDEITRHWHAALPGRILDLRYEDLIARPEETARRAVAHLGLPWDAACLDFHKSARAVRTASASQVRRGLYTGSLGRWRNYEPHLAPLHAAIADLVDAYEAPASEAA